MQVEPQNGVTVQFEGVYAPPELWIYLGAQHARTHQDDPDGEVEWSRVDKGRMMAIITLAKVAAGSGATRADVIRCVLLEDRKGRADDLKMKRQITDLQLQVSSLKSQINTLAEKLRLSPVGGEQLAFMRSLAPEALSGVHEALQQYVDNQVEGEPLPPEAVAVQRIIGGFDAYVAGVL